MTTLSTSPAIDRSIDPADYGDATALHLGEAAIGSTLTSATADALAALDIMARRFGVEKVQFSYNGTPVVVSLGDTDKDAHTDWHTRRTAYQKAAGII